jgi:hypothetical protein
MHRKGLLFLPLKPITYVNNWLLIFNIEPLVKNERLNFRRFLTNHFSGSKKDSVFSTRLFLKHFKIQVQCYGAARPGPKSGQEKK